MSYIGSNVHRIYGHNTDAQLRAAAGQSPATQTQGETLQVSTTANGRKFKGPRLYGNGGWSLFVAVLSASGATQTLTIEYSNLPEPDATNDAHWKDSGIAAVDLTATGQYLLSGIAAFEWIRVKPQVVTSAGSIYAWARVEGIDP